MAVTQVSYTRNLYALIKYLDDEKAHHEHAGIDRRVLSKAGINCNENDAYYQMNQVMLAHNKQQFQQAQHIIISHDKDNLNPADPINWEIAKQIGVEHVQELHQNRMAVVYVQADGEGNNLHTHAVILNCDLEGKLMNGNERTFWTVAEKTDEVCKRHGLQTLDSDKIRNNNKRKDKSTLNIRAIVDDYLTDGKTSNIDEFKERLLEEHNIVFEKSNKSKKDGTYDDVYIMTYDTEKRKGRKRSIKASNLGEEYTKEGIEERYEQLKDRQRELEEQRRQQKNDERLARLSEQVKRQRDELSEEREEREEREKRERDAELERQRKIDEYKARINRVRTQQNKQNRDKRRKQAERDDSGFER